MFGGQGMEAEIRRRWVERGFNITPKCLQYILNRAIEDFQAGMVLA